MKVSIFLALSISGLFTSCAQPASSVAPQRTADSTRADKADSSANGGSAKGEGEDARDNPIDAAKPNPQIMIPPANNSETNPEEPVGSVPVKMPEINKGVFVAGVCETSKERMVGYWHDGEWNALSEIPSTAQPKSLKVTADSIMIFTDQGYWRDGKWNSGVIPVVPDVKSVYSIDLVNDEIVGHDGAGFYFKGKYTKTADLIPQKGGISGVIRDRLVDGNDYYLLITLDSNAYIFKNGIKIQEWSSRGVGQGGKGYLEKIDGKIVPRYMSPDYTFGVNGTKTTNGLSGNAFITDGSLAGKLVYLDATDSVDAVVGFYTANLFTARGVVRKTNFTGEYFTFDSSRPKSLLPLSAPTGYKPALVGMNFQFVGGNTYYRGVLKSLNNSSTISGIYKNDNFEELKCPDRFYSSTAALEVLP